MESKYFQILILRKVIYVLVQLPQEKFSKHHKETIDHYVNFVYNFLVAVWHSQNTKNGSFLKLNADDQVSLKAVEKVQEGHGMHLCCSSLNT
jgi:hypothetical protein